MDKWLNEANTGTETSPSTGTSTAVLSGDIIDLERGGQIQFYRRWMSWEEADTIFRKLLKEIPWEKSNIIVRGQQIKTPRLQAWMGDADIRPNVYSATRVDWTPELLELRNRLQKHFLDSEGGDGPRPRPQFDYVLLNLYQEGSQYISYHADREVRRDDDLIASVSLGATRRFLVKPSGSGPPKEWLLRNGDLMTMNGEMQRHYKHSVPKTAKRIGPRINLTFRQS